MTDLVFVFGTLKEGFPNFTTNRGKRVAGEFVTVERSAVPGRRALLSVARVFGRRG
ncbi:hypothetical protein [Variovorax sp. efr-133-TYG-130]|uniref:hypothetical protein n=1 Tax=Variovorax sp. efr-133-TYG-130 TaxID=3040327 RepID=UPI0025579F72|nr:hypothetical protein [Variovorax sp. efr-133-TYG-130]